MQKERVSKESTVMIVTMVEPWCLHMDTKGIKNGFLIKDVPFTDFPTKTSFLPMKR